MTNTEAQRGAIATARITNGQHTTPADGFAIDLARLDLLTEALLGIANREGWDLDPLPDEP